MENNEVFELVKFAIKQTIPQLDESIITEERSLKDLGANSVERMEIFMFLMEELDLQIPKVDLAAPQSIGELTDLVYDKVVSHVS